MGRMRLFPADTPALTTDVLEDLELEAALLNGLLAARSAVPEQAVRINEALRAVLALLGPSTAMQSHVLDILHRRDLALIGITADVAWKQRPLAARFRDFHRRYQWKLDYTRRLEIDADAAIHGVRRTVGDIRADISDMLAAHS